MRLARISAIALAPLTAVVLSTAPAEAHRASTPRCQGGTRPVVRERDTTADSRLVRVRVGRHRGFDRVVFDLAGSKPSFQSVRYVRRLVQDGSGAPVPVAGRAVLEVVLMTTGHTESGSPTFPAPPNVRGFKALRQIAFAGDFEGNLTFGVGVRHRAGFRVFELTGPDRLVLDVAHCQGRH
jgi:hypothetical protein